MLLFGLHVSAHAAKEPSLTFPQLELVSGRKLKNVTVRSFDEKSGKLLILADGKAMVLPIAEIPSRLHQRITAAAPQSGGTVNTVSGQPPSPIHRPSRPAPVIIPRDGSPTRPRSPDAAPSGAISGDAAHHALARHREAALRHAERYYAFEHQLGSNAGKVTALDFEMTAPKAVAGWEGRYETAGKAFLEFFDGKGGSFRRTTSAFEVITEQKHGEELKVIALNVKS